MLTKRPFRTALTALFAAAALFVVAAVTDKGEGHGFTDGTQSIADTAWILMLLLIGAAALLVVLGLVAVVRRRDA